MPTEKGGTWSRKAFQRDEFQEESYYVLSIDTVESLSQNRYCQVQTQKHQGFKQKHFRSPCRVYIVLD